MKTETEGVAAIETAVRMAQTSKESAIIRLFAIAQVFYRRPIGDRAIEEMEKICDHDAVGAMFFICGYSGGGSFDQWERLGFPR